MSENTSFKNMTVVSFESRMASEMRKLVENFGGRVINAPSMREVPLEENSDALEFAEKLFAGQIEIMIFLTGVGAKALADRLALTYGNEKFINALKKLTVIVRGPKPLKVMREWNVPVYLQAPEPNTWRELLNAMDEADETASLKGRTVALQEYGQENAALAEALLRRGARLIRVPVYRWALPEDIGPLKEAIQRVAENRADVCLFTSATQIHHAMRVAEQEGRGPAFKKGLNHSLIASVGPVCTEALLEFGIGVDLEPEHPKMGTLVIEVSRNARTLLDKKRQARSEVRVTAPAAPRTDAWQTQVTDSIFLKACRREKTDRVPIWLMRQAGRYMKEYRDIRRKVPFIELCKNRDLVTQITVEAQERLGVDAAIIFSDLLVVLEPMGLDLEYGPGEGPMIRMSLSEGLDVNRLGSSNPLEPLTYVFDAIRQTRKALKPHIPLIGFLGAPFTLASYIIEGGGSKTYSKTKAFFYSKPDQWAVLMRKLLEVLKPYLKAQVDAGVQAIQVFDSWVGCLSREDYREYVLPYSKELLDSAPAGVPLIHFGTRTEVLLELMSEAGGSVIGVDSQLAIDEAWKRIGYDKAIMGNLDPAVLLASDQALIRRKAAEILKRIGSRPGHIFNLGHGVLPSTPFENAKYLVDAVHELGRI